MFFRPLYQLPEVLIHTATLINTIVLIATLTVLELHAAVHQSRRDSKLIYPLVAILMLIAVYSAIGQFGAVKP